MVPEFRFMEHCWLVFILSTIPWGRRLRPWDFDDFDDDACTSTMPAVQPSTDSTHEVKVTDMVKDGTSGYDNHVGLSENG